VIRIWIPETPPSFNTVGSRGHWRKYTKVKKEWQEMIGILLLAEWAHQHGTHHGKMITPVRVTATMRFPQKRSRDEGNFRVMLEKATGDALVAGKWIPDDTPEFYTFGTVTFNPRRGLSKTTLTFHEGGT
jgi:hypothetical protein